MKKKPTPQPAATTSRQHDPPSGGPSPVVSLQWRRTQPPYDLLYLVAIKADGTEAKVTTLDGHVPTIGG